MIETTSVTKYRKLRNLIGAVYTNNLYLTRMHKGKCNTLARFELYFHENSETKLNLHIIDKASKIGVR